jgi:hypothetical protein
MIQKSIDVNKLNELLININNKTVLPYWTTTKINFTKRLKELPTPYHRDIWNYLQAYIIRGEINKLTWKACYKLYETSGLLATSTKYNTIAQDLSISDKKVRLIINELDDAGHVVKVPSKDNNTSKNNPNIYIIGISSTDNNNEVYFVDKNKPMTSTHKDELISIYKEQIKITSEVENVMSRIKKIEHCLF